MKEMVERLRLCYIATVTTDGNPKSVSQRKMFQVLGVFAEATLTAIRRASSRASSWLRCVGPAHPRNKRRRFPVAELFTSVLTRSLR